MLKSRGHHLGGQCDRDFSGEIAVGLLVGGPVSDPTEEIGEVPS